MTEHNQGRFVVSYHDGVTCQKVFLADRAEVLKDGRLILWWTNQIGMPSVLRAWGAGSWWRMEDIACREPQVDATEPCCDASEDLPAQECDLEAMAKRLVEEIMKYRDREKPDAHYRGAMTDAARDALRKANLQGYEAAKIELAKRLNNASRGELLATMKQWLEEARDGKR